jgi:hypothetical protein
MLLPLQLVAPVAQFSAQKPVVVSQPLGLQTSELAQFGTHTAWLAPPVSLHT